MSVIKSRYNLFMIYLYSAVIKDCAIIESVTARQKKSKPQLSHVWSLRLLAIRLWTGVAKVSETDERRLIFFPTRNAECQVRQRRVKHLKATPETPDKVKESHGTPNCIMFCVLMWIVSHFSSVHVFGV